MAVTTSGNQILKEQVVNEVLVYREEGGDYARYLAALDQYYGKMKKYQSDIAKYNSKIIKIGDPPTPPSKPEPKNYFTMPLRGLRIIDVSVSEKTKMTSSPIETGVEITDFKVRMPVEIKIKGICDNLREEKNQLEADTDTRDRNSVDIPIIGGAISAITNGIANTVFGYDYEQTLVVLTRARAVYASIHAMLMDKHYVRGVRHWDDRVGNLPEFYTIATKGVIYKNMILESVEQLNDAEHLMVIPVTLNFKEVILASTAGEDNVVPGNNQDGPLTMSGSIKSSGLWGSIKDLGASVGSAVGGLFS